MKEEIYRWVKTIAFFYIVFSAVLHLVPDVKYERYIRSFMGILLIYILSTPVFNLFGNGEKLLQEFRLNYQEELTALEEKNTENLQALYLQENYSRELQKEISKKCKENGIETEDIVVHINGDQITAVISTAGNITQEQERGIRDGLARDFGIEEKNCQLLMMNRQHWLVILLLGLLLMVIAFPISKTETETENQNFSTTTGENMETKTDLEMKLEDLLKNVEGVGNVKVMLMTESGQGLYGSGGNEVTGVLIVAEGADNSVTVRKIQEAVMALFQIDAHKIRIMKMK